MVFWKAHVCSQQKKVIKYQALIDGLCFFLMNSIRNFVYAEMMVCLIPNINSWILYLFIYFFWPEREFLLRLSPLTHSCPPLPSVPKNLDKLKIHIQG